MPRKTVKIEIPGDPSARVDLIGKVLEKHDQMGAASPIPPAVAALMRQGFDIAKPADDEAVRLRNLSTIETGKRDNALGSGIQSPNTAMFGLGQSKAILLGYYASNPKMLTEFGFIVKEGEVVHSSDKTKKEEGV